MTGLNFDARFSPFTLSTCGIWVPRGCCKSTRRAYNNRSQWVHEHHRHETQGPHRSVIRHVVHHRNFGVWVKSQVLLTLFKCLRVIFIKGIVRHFEKYAFLLSCLRLDEFFSQSSSQLTRLLLVASYLLWKGYFTSCITLGKKAKRVLANFLYIPKSLTFYSCHPIYISCIPPFFLCLETFWPLFIWSVSDHLNLVNSLSLSPFLSQCTCTYVCMPCHFLSVAV